MINEHPSTLRTSASSLTKSRQDPVLFTNLQFDNEKTIAYFPKINPTYTVLSNKNGVFYNARTDLTASFKEFYTNCRNTIDYFKKEEDIVLDYNSDDLAVYYISCITSLSMESMKHPTPAYNYVSNSVPRVFWDKYYYNEFEVVIYFQQMV